MQFIKVGERLINLGTISYIQRKGDTVYFAHNAVAENEHQDYGLTGNEAIAAYEFLRDTFAVIIPATEPAATVGTGDGDSGAGTSSIEWFKRMVKLANLVEAEHETSESLRTELALARERIAMLEGYLEEIESEGFIEDVGLSRWKKIRIINPD